jgi:hypothetical protein
MYTDTSQEHTVSIFRAGKKLIADNSVMGIRRGKSRNIGERIAKKIWGSLKGILYCGNRTKVNCEKIWESLEVILLRISQIRSPFPLLLLVRLGPHTPAALLNASITILSLSL